MKKIFIIGSNGYIGKRLAKKFSDKYEIMQVSKENSENNIPLDLENVEKFDFSQIKSGDSVIFLAAISSPDQCANNYDYSYKINVTGTGHFIQKSLEQGANVLFFSSDAVYGASSGKIEDYFDERSKCNLLGEYATMKREIEERFLNSDAFKVFRLSYVFSKNDKFMLYLKNCVENREVAEIFHPFFRNAIYIEDVMVAVDELVCRWEKIKEKVINVVGSEPISRLKMAEIYKQNVSPSLKIKIVKPEESFFRNRPQYINVKSIYLASLLKKNTIEFNQAFGQEFNN